MKFKLKDNLWSHVKQRYYIDPPFWKLFKRTRYNKQEYSIWLAVYPTKKDMDSDNIWWKPEEGFLAFDPDEVEPLDEEASLVLVKMLLDVTE